MVSTWSERTEREGRVIWKLAQSVLLSIYHTPTVNNSDFLIIFLNLDVDLLVLTELGNLFQMKGPPK